MNVCIAGKNNIAVDVCSHLLERYPNYQVLIVRNRTDKGIDGFQRSFWKFAKDNNIKVVSLDEIYMISDLIFLSLEFDRLIVPDRFLSKQLFNIHFSLLPEYKGMYTSALPILNAEKRSGVTLHKIDSGIDTGDILCQKEIVLSSSETSNSLYHKYIKIGTSLVIESIDTILNNTYETTPQNRKYSSYYSKASLNYSDLHLDLIVTAYQLDCQIRAFNFRYYQLPEIYGVSIVGTSITDERSLLRPGVILEDNEYYFLLSTIDYNIYLYKDQFCRLLKYCESDDLLGLQSIPQLSFYLLDSDKIHGWTPLMIAAYNNSISVCKYLIEQGADVNAQNFNGTTVIMYAKDAVLNTGNYEIMNILLENGANPFMTDYSGRNLFDYLRLESVKLLKYIKEKWSNS